MQPSPGYWKAVRPRRCRVINTAGQAASPEQPHSQQRRERILTLVHASRLYTESPPHMRGQFNTLECLPDLLAHELCEAVERRMRTCLGREFCEITAEISRVRGRVDVLRSERRQLFMQAKVACRFQTLTVDTLLNRYVLSALLLLPSLCSDTSVRLCHKYAAAMERAGVLGPCPAEADMRAVRMRQSKARTPDARKDAHMLEAAQLAHVLKVLRPLSG